MRISVNSECMSMCRRSSTSKSVGWNMFWMITTRSCLLRSSAFFSGLQSNCLQTPAGKIRSPGRREAPLHTGMKEITCRMKKERKKMVLLLLLQFFAILFVLLFLLAGIILAFQLKTSRFNMQPVTSDLILIQQTLSQRYGLSLNTHTH